MSKSKRQTKSPKFDPKMVVKAHQFLYYQGRAVWTDHGFDAYCRKHGINGSGGSDRASDYTLAEIALAEQFEKNPQLLV